MIPLAVGALIAAFLMSIGLCIWIVRQKQESWLDEPNERSLHSAPVSRLGGVGIWTGVVVGGLLAYRILESELNFYGLTAAVILFVVALMDDRKSLPPLARLLAQIFAVTLAVVGGKLYISWDFAAPIWPWIGVFMLLWGVNLYNFMDGMDGFAGTMAAAGFSVLAILGLLQGQEGFALSCGLLAAASAGFLCLNFPPAKIFMGDSGSTVMGFAMVAVSVSGWKQGLYSFWSPLVIFSPFWVDATITLLRRLFNGERIWQAHRQHFYQQCVLAGHSHRRVVGAYALIMILCAATVLAQQVFLAGYNEAIVPLCWLLFYVLVALWGAHMRCREKTAH